MNLRQTLEMLAAGEITVHEAESRLAFSDIAAIEDFARLDLGRHSRKGVPEVVYAPGKSTEQLLGICEKMVEASGSSIISGMDEEQRAAVEDRFAVKLGRVEPEAGIAVLRQPGHEPVPTGGVVGLLSAGTSDIPVAQQAAVMAEEMGCRVIRAFDVGVAGVHRLVEPMRELMEARVAAIVVAAGMEGALPSVVAGLAPVPVIGLPTSTGYGLGGGGVTALLTMLQSCCPGLVAVNIDNGIGAGATAALIANRVAAAEYSPE